MLGSVPILTNLMVNFSFLRQQKQWVGIAAILLALSIPATIPFWQPDFFISADSPLHLWRVFELDRMLRTGVFYPRWATDLFFGYGYPVFNFYPPLAYYITETLHLLGFDIAVAIKIEFGITVLIAEAGMFLLSRDVFADAPESTWQKDAAALAAAVGFGYAPYFLIDIYIRGAIAETLGLAFLPLFFWSLRRVLSKPQLAGVMLAGICGALLLLSHNLTAFLTAPIIAFYALLRIFALPARPLRFKAFLGALTVAALALALSAFYWLPAVLELSMVYIGQPALSQGELHKTILEHFKTIQTVIQPQFFYDYPEAAYPLGATWVLLAVVGMTSAIIFLKRHARVEMIYFAIVCLVAGFGLLDVSRPVWLSVPALWVFQFTWRLTVLICLGGALAMGGWVVLIQRLTRQKFAVGAATVALVLVLMVSAMWDARAKPWYAPMPTASNPQALARYESNSNAFGMSSQNEYLPAWVKLLPNPVNPQVRVLRDADAALANAGLLDIQFQDIQPASAQFLVNAKQAAALTWRAFYYPDWYAWIDNQPAPLRASTRLGLLTLDIPAGTHTIRLTHASTPLRDLANGLTLLGVLVVCGGAVTMRRRGTRGWVLPLAILGAVILIFGLPQVRAVTAHPPPVTNVNLQVSDSLRLLGWSSERTSASTLTLSLFWQATQLMPKNEPTRIQLSDSAGKVWSSRTQLARYGVGDERYWIPNEIAPDVYDLFLPDNLPAGEFTFEIARGDLPFQRVGSMTLDGGSPSNSLPPIQNPIEARLGDSIHLLGVNASLADLHPNDSVPLTLFWRTDAGLTEDLIVFIHLLDKDGKLAAQQDGLSNNGFSPTMLWAPGAVIADHHTLKLPATLPPGIYQLVTGLYRYRNLQRLPVTVRNVPSEDDFVTLGTVRISADAPFSPAARLENKFGADIELRGLTLDVRAQQGNVLTAGGGGLPQTLAASPGQRLHLTLAWFARQPIPTDYTVYAHLVDANGALVKQQDNPPVGGNYPTTLWQAGERIVDDYQLELNDLPPGEYRLYVGMYASTDGTRLPVTAADGATLPNNELLVARITVSQ